MQQEEREHRRRHNPFTQLWSLSHRALAILLIALFGGLLAGVALTSSGEAVGERLFGIGVVFAILALAWIDNRFETRGKERPWRELADRTGLECQVGGFLAGYAVQVAGSYRGRALTLYTPKKGKSQVPLTRIELVVANEAHAAFRLRGPFPRDTDRHDPVISGLFATTRAQQFGDDQRFFIRSQPIHIATALLSRQPVWSNLLQLDTLTTIELEDRMLMLEQVGVIVDVEQLQRMFDLLSDLAEIIQQQARRGHAPPVT